MNKGGEAFRLWRRSFAESGSQGGWVVGRCGRSVQDMLWSVDLVVPFDKCSETSRMQTFGHILNKRCKALDLVESQGQDGRSCTHQLDVPLETHFSRARHHTPCGTPPVPHSCPGYQSSPVVTQAHRWIFAEDKDRHQ